MNGMDRSWGYYVAEGSVFVILGIIALLAPWFFTLSFEMLLGWLFLFGGIIQAFRTFQTKDAPGFLFSLLSSIFLIVAGVIMLGYPLSGAMTITLVLAFFYLFDGIAKLVLAFQESGHRAWLLFGALIEFAIAYLIWSHWPTSALWFIGILVGVWMVYYGASSIAYGIRHKKRAI